MVRNVTLLCLHDQEVGDILVREFDQPISLRKAGQIWRQWITWAGYRRAEWSINDDRFREVRINEA